ncbi:LysE/ArgO family amino acid transporter [Clostridium oryzae]|uniref:Arginine exporter protein ArgO n=1 Tax=Clostridium oryzae TaxID=1450648 RepID=A0A1V4I5F5_9CLOT|nr:LysE family transporter [Clostridium oryzae]OPJ55196.1 arginine exporter protein ArgO [Clostridium oryzae]
MIKYLIQGFMLGLAYVAPIGMQNLYVINTAATQKKVNAYRVAFITIFFDISLALSCFFGMGALMEKFTILKMIVMLIGAFLVIYIGIQLIRSNPDINSNITIEKSVLKVVVSCFSITWLNPQAIIDGSLLLGGFRESLPHAAAILFIGGVCLASFSWFTIVTTVVSALRQKFNRNIIKIINVVCGVVIIYYGLKLAYSFVKLQFV